MRAIGRVFAAMLGLMAQTLEHVGRTYASDPHRADILLDEFIAFLRDAIPRLRTD
jgi:hypothetical protein